MKSDTSFWQEMNQLIRTTSIIIDQRKGSWHPRYPEVIYPLDHGYLATQQPAMEAALTYGLVQSNQQYISKPMNY